MGWISGGSGVEGFTPPNVFHSFTGVQQERLESVCESTRVCHDEKSLSNVTVDRLASAQIPLPDKTVPVVVSLISKALGSSA